MESAPGRFVQDSLHCPLVGIVLRNKYPKKSLFVLFINHVPPRSDVPRNYTVHIFCPMCHDIFTPRSSRSASIDGAYFGTTFPHLFMLTFPECIPKKNSQCFVAFRVISDSQGSLSLKSFRSLVYLDFGYTRVVHTTLFLPFLHHSLNAARSHYGGPSQN